ncbi:hypothetical protein QJR26_06955 [Clostridium baratii]
MKLSIKELQMLDLLLKRISSRLTQRAVNLKFNVVFISNNRILTGDFLTIEKDTSTNIHYIKESILDSSNWIISRFVNSNDLLNEHIRDFKYYHYDDISENTTYILLDSLVELIKKADLTSFEYKPFLYNAVYLESELKLPFVWLDSDCEYEVISIKVTKE